MSEAERGTAPEEGSLSFFRRAEKEQPAPAPGLSAGKQVGDFRLVALIGQGGMGQVWEAEQVSLHRTVAVKFVRPERVTERQLELFAREARAGGRLSHSGIVTIYGHGQSDGLAWIAMEFVSGAWTLRDFMDEIARAGEVPEGYDRHVARFVAEVADAMQAAHEAAVIHRDLKPQNVLIARDEHPKVTDFGLARITDESAMSQTGDFAGTYFYMSPEQVTARRMGIDHRTDVFSLGIVLYEMLALQRPFQGDTSHQVAAQIVTKDPPDPRAIRSKVPRDLAVIATHALEKDRDKRYATMKELAADLRRYLADEPIHATPPTRVDRTLKWVRRNPAKSSVAAVVGLALLVISALLVENVRTNRSLELERTNLAQANTSLVAKTEESEARRAEAERRAEEVLRLSAFQRLEDLTRAADNLWPAVPENVPAYERWLVRAGDLVAGLDPRGEERGHRAQLAALRERAVALSASEREEARRSHPRHAELAQLQRKHAALQRSQDVRAGKAGSDSFALDASAQPQDAPGLNALAWPLVAPGRAEFGREAEGLALARLAIELVEDDEQAATAGSTLAWALHANGLDEEALSEGAAALEAAPPERRPELERDLADLRAAVETARGGSALSTLEAEVAGIEAELSALPVFRFADQEDTWWHNQLEKLVGALEAFTDPETGLIEGVSGEHGWGIARRKALAETIAERSVSGKEAARLWAAAIASIASTVECTLYGGLRIEPELGFLPIGRDLGSGLWEFAHLQTGEPAQRGADGKLVLEEETGLVFVLLPGGTFTMGAQASDPSGPNYDPQAQGDEGPPHAVSLTPFFLSKYEMTQGQWLRFVGKNPSQYGPHNHDSSWNRSGRKADLVHPVEQVSWTTCTEVLARLGLELPSEAQWEYGARGGTTTVWWTGDEKETLQGAANLADRYAKAHGGSGWVGADDSLDDGNTVHARVGSYSANGFGLHDVIGNVWEWCRDGYDGGSYRLSSGRDPVAPVAGSSNRVNRGGGFLDAVVRARLANRNVDTPEVAGNGLGLRPVRALRLAPITTSPPSDR